MLLALVGAGFSLGFAVCSLWLLGWAFRRSVGTGFMVLLVPAYIFIFAFTQFEHPRKPAIVGLFLGCFVLAAVFLGLTEAQLRAALGP